nr:unnamed protein product [Callosobruchus analis]
MMPVVLGST